MAGQRTCGRCVLDSTVPGVTVYDDGTCSYCREYMRRLEKLAAVDKAATFDACISRMRRSGQGRRYDALIGISGGLDSSYAAWIASQAGLRLLGVHVDNGWNTPLAAANICAIAENLGIELVNVTPSWEHFRDLQLAFLRASVRNAEIPTDHVITAALYRTAHAHGIRWIISGGNFVTEGVALPEAYGHYNRDHRYIRSVHRRFGMLSLRPLPTIGIPRTLYYRYVRGIRLVRLLDHVDYIREQAVETLARDIGWKPYSGKHNESVYTRFFQSYILPQKFGLDKRQFHLGALVCCGQMPRQEALDLLAQSPYSVPEELVADRAEVLAKLGLSVAEFERLMRQPVRPDREFHSNRWVFDVARWLVRRGIRLGE